MRSTRLYVDTALEAGREAPLEDEAAHYVRNVLRLGDGEQLRVFNGDGREFLATLRASGKRGLALTPEREIEAIAESPLSVHLGIGLVRGERMDYAVQKATELGVASITPLALTRCTARLEERRADNRLRHWRQIAASACEQCGRARLPKLEEPADLPTWLASRAGMPGLVLHTSGAVRLEGAAATRDMRVLIGPEGGLEAHEFALAQAAGLTPCSLGPRVLRAETAPVAVLAILQFLWGDL